jgi:predicted HTH transcriptional regulator
MELSDVRRLVAAGEGSAIEFKRRVPSSERIAKEIVALANSGGGTLLLGVDDDGTIRGVRDAEEEMYALRTALESHCRPKVSMHIDRAAVTQRRDVIVVRVPSSSRKPHFVVSEGRRTAYVRIEDRSVEASREVTALMRASRSKRDVWFEFGEHEQALMRYLEHYGRITVRQFARLAGISHRRASSTLVRLATANVLVLHARDDEDIFTVAGRNGVS